MRARQWSVRVGVMGLCYSHHKTELIIEQRTSRVLHNLGLQLGVSAGHQVDPHEGVRGAN